MDITGYYYFDHKNREVLHVPKVFVVIEPPVDVTEVILEPRRLKSRLYGLGRVIANDLREIREVKIEEKDIQRVIKLSFSSRKEQARKKCEGIFDKITDLLPGRDEDHFDLTSGYDIDGFDPRFRDSLF